MLKRDDSSSGLHWLTSALMTATGAETAAARARSGGRSDIDGTGWATLALGTTAGGAHLIRAIRPDSGAAKLSRVTDALVLIAGAAEVAAQLHRASEERDRPAVLRWRRSRKRPPADRLPWLAPLAYCATGALGLLVEDTEEKRRIRSLGNEAAGLARSATKRGAHAAERAAAVFRRRPAPIVVRI